MQGERHDLPFASGWFSDRDVWQVRPPCDPTREKFGAGGRDPTTPCAVVWGRMGPLPVDLATVVTKALSKDPANRYETAWKMADD